eukprot:TRINITY_DN20545_c0_g1_i1.p1 TRINITY_DN20545_c0_g1~~TRINITY_DN20545_c0_g1_i1.p1  ORF type:complete len:101 (-),score=12.30 TRINITY_DN20545_c0_g1_i1:309-611(-)
MLRSLVGSEMCIRDSFKIDDFQLLQPPLDRGPLSPQIDPLHANAGRDHLIVWKLVGQLNMPDGGTTDSKLGIVGIVPSLGYDLDRSEVHIHVGLHGHNLS